MNFEKERLKTFMSWPSDKKIDVESFAKAGFYYIGRGLEVQCFSCNTKITTWLSNPDFDHAVIRHNVQAPNCPLILDPSSAGNVPFVELKNKKLKTSESDKLIDKSFDESTDKLSDKSSDKSTDKSTILYSHGRRVSLGSHIVYTVQDPSKEYGTFEQRLKSFEEWPIPLIISPESLAAAGFYYLRYLDMVECPYCRGVLMNWKDEENPEREHWLNFPHCKFIQQRRQQENYAENDKFKTVKLLLAVKQSNCSQVLATSKELGIQNHIHPKYLQYALYEKRLETFKSWPEERVQTPEKLADAGFFYTGHKDHVTCFHCGGGLSNWKSEDKEWVEHARWFSFCSFVNLVCGAEFVQYCVDTRPCLNSSIDSIDNINEDAIPELKNVDLNLAVDMTETETELHAALFSRVKETLKRRRELGKPYTNFEQFVLDVLSDQDASFDTSKLINLLNQIAIPRPKNLFGEIQDLNIARLQLGKEETNNKSDDLLSQEECKNLKEARLCKICMDHVRAIAFLPCGHLATCTRCAPCLMNCPICRLNIRGNIRIFMP